MKTFDLDVRIKSVLAEDARLRAMLVRAPSAEYIPFGGSRASFYLLVSLCLGVEVRAFNELAYACLTALRLTISSELLSGYAGLEIVPYIMEKGEFRRVLRLSVLSAALCSSRELTNQDLLQERPREGITCGWYFGKPDNPDAL